MNGTEVKARLAKPCPCCGSLDIWMDSPEWLKENGLHSLEIMCKACGLSITAYDYYFDPDTNERVDTSLREAYRTALKRWNRRAA